MTGSRKLAAILAADVVGYSRLMGEDEAGTAQAVRERHAATSAIVAVHGGRVFKTMGDGIFIEFPSVVSAVECALAGQRMMVERNDVPDEAPRLPHRCEPRGRVGRGRRPSRRRRQYRSAARSHRRARRRLDFRGGLRSCSREDRGGICRSWRCAAEEHRAASARLLGDPAARRGGKSGDAPTSSERPRLSIVVLPFANISGDSEQDYFVDGVTESLTTDLSRMSGMLVIGRNTAFTYKGKAVDLKQIGRELNVRYVLEGSVQRGGNRMRVNVQLIDAENGTHLWADRFEKPVADLFDMQDEIVARLANTLNAQLVAAEARRAEKAPFHSIDLLFQGVACANRGTTLEVLQQARGYFERALTLDPDNLDALLQKPIVDATIGGNFDPADRAARLGAAETALTQRSSPLPRTPRPTCSWARPDVDQPRGARHRRVRTRVGARSKSGRRAWVHGSGEDIYRTPGRARGSRRRGAAAEPARQQGLFVDRDGRLRQAAPRARRGGGRVVAAIDREPIPISTARISGSPSASRISAGSRKPPPRFAWDEASIRNSPLRHSAPLRRATIRPISRKANEILRRDAPRGRARRLIALRSFINAGSRIGFAFVTQVQGENLLRLPDAAELMAAERLEAAAAIRRPRRRIRPRPEPPGRAARTGPRCGRPR